MSRKLLRRLVIGASFAAALLLLLGIGSRFTSPVVITQMQIQMSPDFPVFVLRWPGDPFLGPAGVSSLEFASEGFRELMAGPGRIAGVAAVNGTPVTGLMLRLYLDPNLMSPWITTDSNGQYQIEVPYGEYKIEGFELDMDSANANLPGKILHPQNAYSSEVFDVSEAVPGRGLNLSFVDAIDLEIPKKNFSSDEEIIISWKSYPGANEYAVVLYDLSDTEYPSRGNRVEWSKLPLSLEPTINLTEYYSLEEGQDYAVYVAALNKEGRLISYSESRDRDFDFQIVD